MKELNDEISAYIQSMRCELSKKAGCAVLFDYFNYKQVSEFEYRAGLRTRNYDEYAENKKPYVEIFIRHGFVLFSEKDISTPDKRELIMEMVFYTKEHAKKIEHQKALELATQLTSKNRTQHINGPVHGDVITVETIHAERTTNNAVMEENKKKWYENAVAQWVISFLLGVSSSIVAQQLWNYFTTK